jgi:hypothetical protein
MDEVEADVECPVIGGVHDLEPAVGEGVRRVHRFNVNS